MKVLFLIIILSLTPVHMFGQDKLVISCGESEGCVEYKSKLAGLLKSMPDRSMIKKTLKDFIRDDNIFDLKFSILEKVGSGIALEVDFKIKERIRSIQVESNIEDSLETFLESIGVAEGVFIQDIDFNSVESSIQSFGIERGHRQLIFSKSVQKDSAGINLFLKLNFTRPLLVENIEVDSSLQNLKVGILKKLKRFTGRPFNSGDLENEIKEIQDDILSRGFYLATIRKKVISNENTVDVKVFVDSGKKYIFNFTGNVLFSQAQLKGILRAAFNVESKQNESELMKNAIEMAYQGKGYYQVNIHFRKVEDSFNNRRYYYIGLKENKKTYVQKINLIGNEKMSNSKIMDLYYESASVIASRDYFDKKYLENFPKILRKFYFENGFVLNNVSKPYFRFSKNKRKVEVEYRVVEGNRCTISRINFQGINDELIDYIGVHLNNKNSSFLNIVKLEEDYKKIINLLRSKGYFFVKVLKLRPNKVIEYSSDYRQAIINIYIDLGPKIFRRDVIIAGNIKTKRETILREVRIAQNDVITPSKIKKIESRLNNTGLFSEIEIRPLKQGGVGNSQVDLFIKVTERDFGVVEIAPGFRTDLGLKVSGVVSYNNLQGKNRSAQLRLQTNYRIDESTIDSERRNKSSEKLEYSGRLSYDEPYLLNLPVGLNSGIEASRKRFFSFDADILKVTSTISKGWTDWLNTFLKYQYESIGQFEASDDKDNDNFQIGSLTPGFSLDFRDNKIIPSKGFFLSLSSEFANKLYTFGDDKNEDFNFLKLVNRNYFYFPIGRSITFAVSYAMGFQKNLDNEIVMENGQVVLNDDGVPQTKTRIPSIKVFRLNGIDTIRGFEDSEINILEDGPDISDLVIQTKVFFSALKFEPRFYFGDNLVLAPFFDAGRLFVDNFKPLKLRTSVGLGLKLVTPVGTLDFNYGVKLKRELLPSGNFERPGKFHLSIGHF